MSTELIIKKEGELDEKEDNYCIICLDNHDTDILSFPISRSTCLCKYHIHIECLLIWKMNCPICNKEIKRFTISDLQDINLNKVNENKLNGCCGQDEVIIIIIISILIGGLIIFIFSIVGGI